MFSEPYTLYAVSPAVIHQRVVDVVSFWIGASSQMLFLIHHHFLLVSDCLIFFWVKKVAARF